MILEGVAVILEGVATGVVQAVGGAPQGVVVLRVDVHVTGMTRQAMRRRRVHSWVTRWRVWT